MLCSKGRKASNSFLLLLFFHSGDSAPMVNSSESPLCLKWVYKQASNICVPVGVTIGAAVQRELDSLLGRLWCSSLGRDRSW